MLHLFPSDDAIFPGREINTAILKSTPENDFSFQGKIKSASGCSVIDEKHQRTSGDNFRFRRNLQERKTGQRRRIMDEFPFEFQIGSRCTAIESHSFSESVERTGWLPLIEPGIERAENFRIKRMDGCNPAVAFAPDCFSTEVSGERDTAIWKIRFPKSDIVPDFKTEEILKMSGTAGGDVIGLVIKESGFRSEEHHAAFLYIVLESIRKFLADMRMGWNQKKRILPEIGIRRNQIRINASCEQMFMKGSEL